MSKPLAITKRQIKTISCGAWFPASARLLTALLLALSLLGSRPVAAETLDQAYARALKDFYAGKYKRAVDTFERILAVPTDHEDLHYNLGCAHYRLGNLGPAIYHFERASALDPDAEDARFNLKTARATAATRVKDELKGAARAIWWHRLVDLLQPGSWTVLFLTAWWAALVLLFVVRLIRSGPLRAGLIATNGLLGALVLLLGLALLGREYRDHKVVQGIVLPAKMPVREGPNSSTKTTFTLHAGFKVRVQRTESGWVRIRLNNGLEGWVPKAEIGVL